MVVFVHGKRGIKELNDNFRSDVYIFADELPPCPPRLEQISVDDRFKEDGAGFLSDFFHPGSTSCFRSVEARYDYD